jgi:transposase
MAMEKTFTGAQWKEIKRRMAKLSGKKVDAKGYRRLTAPHMRGQGFSNAHIAAALGFSAPYITELVSKYKKYGLDAILTDKRTSNNRRMDADGEKAFLKEIVEIAEAGQMTTVENMPRKFEETTGKESNTSTIYKLLKRHGWRKIKPRPEHPGKASEAEIAASKKLTKNTGKSYWIKIEEMGETSINNMKA